MKPGIVRLYPSLCLPAILLVSFVSVAKLAAQTLPVAPDALAQANLRIASAPASPATHPQVVARRDLLITLIREHPASARAYALSPAVRAALVAADPTAVPLLEQDTAVTGELLSAVADDFAHNTSTVRYAVRTPTADLDLSFAVDVSQAPHLVHHPVTVQGLALGGIMAVESFAPASPVALPPGQANLSLPAARPMLNPSPLLTPTQAATYAAATTTAAPAACSTTGNQHIAVIIIRYPGNVPAYPTGMDQTPYWNTVVNGSYPSVNTYWSEASFGQTSCTGDVYGPYTLTQAFTCATTSGMQTAALAAATTAGVNFSLYNRIVIVFPATPDCTFGGLGSIGCGGSTSVVPQEFSVTWLPVYSTYNATGYPQFWGGSSHELGHNLGLNHASTMDFGKISLGPLDFTGANTITGTENEYGDNFAVMGNPWNSAGPYSAEHDVKLLGWIPAAGEQDVTSAGTFSLAPAENSTGLRALRVLRESTSNSWIWLEFHQSIGAHETANIANNQPDTLASGAFVHYDSGFLDNGHTYMLDMTPTASPNNFNDGTLAPGKSWSDPYTLLTLSATTQTSSALGINVSYDAPCATVSLASAPIPAAGGSANLSISAPSTCSWTASSNATWITFPGTTSGTGSATIPFTVTANTTSSQRNSYVTAQRQSLPLVQSGTRINLISSVPSSGTSAPGIAVPFTLAYNDAAGLSDITQMNFSLSGNGSSCNAAVVFSGGAAFFYLGTSTGFTSGISPGSGTISVPACSLTGAGSSYTTSGTNATLTFNLTFPSAFLGTHSISASAYGAASYYGPSIPLGYWVVSSTPSMTMSPPIGTQGTTQPVAFSGVNTSFSSASTVSVSGTGVTVTGINAPSTTNLTASFVIASTATLGIHTVTVTTGTEVVSSTFTVNAPLSSTTTLAVTPTNPGAGATVTMTATVAPAAATGTVTFTDGTATLGTATLAAGVATFTSSTLAAGSHSITATYSGDATYATSKSTASAVTVSAASTVSVTASPAAPGTGSSVTLSAAVAPAGATGTVTFTDGTTTLATSTVTSGTASFATSALTAGTHSIVATYSGDATYGTSKSSALSLVVLASTTTTLVLPAPVPAFGAGLTITATVLPSTATGTVTFSDGTSTLGTASLAAGTAAFSTSGLLSGAHSISATYAGDAGDTASKSSTSALTVPRAITTTVLSASPAPLYAGAPVAFTATVSDASAGATATGSVVFSDAGTTLSTVPLINGVATLTTSTLPAGAHSITASYSGTTDITASAAVPQSISILDFTISAASTAISVSAGGTASATLTLSPVAGGFNQPISFSCAGAPAATQCVISPNAITPGTTTSTATVSLATTGARVAPGIGAAFLLFAPIALLLRRRLARGILLAAVAFASLSVVSLSGCSKSSAASTPGSTGTPIGASVITVTATAAGTPGLTHTVTFTLNVN